MLLLVDKIGLIQRFEIIYKRLSNKGVCIMTNKDLVRNYLY